MPNMVSGDPYHPYRLTPFEPFHSLTLLKSLQTSTFINPINPTQRNESTTNNALPQSSAPVAASQTEPPQAQAVQTHFLRLLSNFLSTTIPIVFDYSIIRFSSC